MRNQIARIALPLSIMLMAGLGSYIYLNWSFHPTPGWTPPIQIQDKGSDPLLAYHNGQLWFSFFTAGEEGREVKVIRSPDGIEWSSPTVLVKGSPEICAFPYGLRLLERPDGQLWFFWSGGTRDTDCRTNILYYSILIDDHQWSNPQEAYRIEDDYFFQSVTNAQGGGLAVLEDRNRGYAVQILDENLEKNPPITLDIPEYFYITNIFLDQHDILWLVCSRENSAFLLTSNDGTTWSWPRGIFIENFSAGKLFQRENGQYVVIYHSGYNSLSMTFSPDSYTWSEPTLVVRMEQEDDWLGNRIYGYDIAESDDGHLWVVFERREGFSLTKFSDEQLLEDTDMVMNLRLKNRIVALSVALIAGAAWLAVTRSPLYRRLPRK